MTYTFTVELDPDDADFFSVFIDNGHGASAEVAGRIGYRVVAEAIAHTFNTQTQETIRTMFEIKES